MKTFMFLICFVALHIIASTTSTGCPVIPGTFRKVISGSDVQVDLSDSFALSIVEVSGKSKGFAGYSDSLKTGILALTLSTSGSLIDDELNVRSALASLDVRVRPWSLIANPVITIASTWDQKESVRAHYGMSTDANNAQSCGLKKRINQIASKILGISLAPLNVVTDHMVPGKTGFITSIELAKRGTETIAIIAVSAADHDGALDTHSLTTGSAPARCS